MIDDLQVYVLPTVAKALCKNQTQQQFTQLDKGIEYEGVVNQESNGGHYLDRTVNLLFEILPDSGFSRTRLLRMYKLTTYHM